MREIKLRYVWERPRSYATGGYRPTDPKVLFSFITLDDMDKRARHEYDYEFKSIHPSITKGMNSRLKEIIGGFHILKARDLYTGLKDKNGKEIYEGDILRLDEFYLNWLVEWHESGFYIRNPHSSSTYFVFENQLAITREIIGNIYENGDLLK